MLSRDREGLPAPIRADVIKGTVTAILVPLTLGLVVQPLVLPQVSLPSTPVVWLPGLALAVVGLLSTTRALRTLASSFRGSKNAEPRELSTTGPFAYVRNPVYVGGLIFVVGLGFFLLSTLVLVYAVLLWIAFHLLVVRVEEPAMRHLFPVEYATYAERTPRWLPRSPREGPR